MAQEYTNAQLERMVLGKVEKPNVVFYEESCMDVEKSKAAGRRIYSTVLMVKYTQPGVTDWAPQRAQKQDILNNQEAYQYFLQTKGDVGSPSVKIIPGIKADEAQELIDYGIVTITKLCDAEVLPRHLLHLQASARRLNEVMKDEQTRNQQEHDSYRPSTGDAEVEIETQNVGQAKEEDWHVPAPDRRDDTVGMRRRVLPTGPQDGGGETREGLRSGGRDDGGQGTIPGPEKEHDSAWRTEGVNTWGSPNWSITFEPIRLR